MNQLPFRGTQINNTHLLAKGLIGCWLFNENTGNLAHDSSNNNNIGNINNCTWSDGISCNGSTSYTLLPNINVSGLDEITVMGWVKPISVIQDGTIIGCWGGSQIFLLWADNASPDGWCCVFKNSNSEYYMSPKETIIVDLNKWVFVASTFKRNDTFNLYVNGIKTYSTTTTDYPINSHSTDNPQIGSDLGNIRNFDGYIRDVRIYNRALSLEEITQLQVNPYKMFESRISPALLYHATAAGVANAGAMIMAMMR